jgi:hypothetical protein
MDGERLVVFPHEIIATRAELAEAAERIAELEAAVATLRRALRGLLEAGGGRPSIQANHWIADYAAAKATARAALDATEPDGKEVGA